MFDRNLIVEGWVDELDFTHLKELLLSLEYILEEVLSHHLIWQHIVLPTKVHKLRLSNIQEHQINVYNKSTYRFYSKNLYQSVLEDNLD